MGFDQLTGALSSTDASSAIRVTATAVCVCLAIGAAAPLLARRARRDAGLLRVADVAVLSPILFALLGWASAFGHARRLRKGN